MRIKNSKEIRNDILEKIKKRYKKEDLTEFYVRLGENFGDIFRNFQRLYGDREDFDERVEELVAVLLDMYQSRSEELKKIDREREVNSQWYLSEKWVATMLYVDRFAGDLKGFANKIDYLEELGINYVHLMPLLKSPKGENDGGYAVSDYTKVDERFGTMEDIKEISEKFRKKGMILELDLVLNHTSDEHDWAKKAMAGEKKYQDYYYMYSDREIPDKFEETLPEIFPDLAPGNFTYKDEIDRWVFTVFNSYQWDLNYTNPEVFIKMTEILLNLANNGVDILRLDAVAFLWKRIGTNSQNEQEAHYILQLFKSCAKIAAPGVAFKAEAIVQPAEIVKYLGEGDAAGKECEIAYNASYMVFLWDAIATKNVKLLEKGLENMPRLPKGTTWINYVRCHDDIGLGFSDLDASQVAYDPRLHRKFLIDYYTGDFYGSMAEGNKFMYNPKTGDARISGSLASLAGLQRAVESGNDIEKEKALKKIILLHSAIMSFGGIPLIYYGDELAYINDYSYLKDDEKIGDNRWMHRPVIDWKKAEKRKIKGTYEEIIFSGIRKLIEKRKTLKEFYGENNYEFVRNDNIHVFSFLRERDGEKTLVLMNFSDEKQYIDYKILFRVGLFGTLVDIYNEEEFKIENGKIELEAYDFLWIKEKRQ